MKNIKILLLLLFITIGQSFGAIVHVTTNDTLNAAMITTNSVSYNILSGTLDLSHWGFAASGFQIDQSAISTQQTIARAAYINPTYALSPLNLGDTVDVAASTVTYSLGWLGSIPYSVSSGSPSVIANNQSTYFGFVLLINNSIHHGWLKITRLTSDIIVINEYAYDNVANASILVGATSTTPSILVTSITVIGQNNASTITTNAGTLQMVETVLPTNATNSTVTWSVQNGTGSATISTTGLLTAVSNGTVTVTATANDGSNVSGSTVVTISNQQAPNVLVTSITVVGQGNVSTITTNAGTLQMVENVLPTNATNNTVTWSVQNGTGSATISNTGLLTAVSNGTVTVTATANDGSNVSGSTVITITNQGPTSVKDIRLEKISIFPNPLRNGMLNILGDLPQKLCVEIVSSTGVMITGFNIQPAERTLDLANLSAGLYFIVFRTEDGSQKLVKLIK